MVMKSDTQIHDDVLKELKWDSKVDETEVGVEVDNGIVTLTGTVNSYAKSIAAEDAAHRVIGVLDVANDLKVKLAGVGAPNDTEIASAVRDALIWNVFVDDTRIKTTVHNGYVTLEGSLDSVSDREEVMKVVRALKGVQGVVNRIQVTKTRIYPSDVRMAIKEALERRAENASRNVTISVDDDEVVLDGQIPSWIEKQAVLDAAKHVNGIMRVVDHLSIAPWSAASAV